ncbi:hypothetical protein J0H58_24435 [bacterium]|nr:hypothetical protein [bacterium]
MPRFPSFRVGKVTGYRRGRVWYLCCFEYGKRLRPRVGPDRDAARQLAAQVNGQIETGAPPALSFDPVDVSTSAPAGSNITSRSAGPRSRRSPATAPPPTTCYGS